MPIDLSAIHLSLLAWLVIIAVAAILVLGIVRAFFQHLLHFFLRGCGLIVLIVVILWILRLLKVL